MIVERREENLFNSLVFTIIQRAIPLLSLCANTKKTPTKKEKSFRTSLLVPYDILFSNKYLRDLGRIWELREIVPDPNNMPWIEKIDK